VLGFWRRKRGFRRIFSFLLKSAPEKCIFTNHVPRLSLKVNWSREQNSVPESRRASLYSVKVIKMSRLTIDPFLILWLFHGMLRYCETECTTFLSLDTQDGKKGQLSCAWNCTRNPRIFWLHLSVRVLASEICCLRLTESTRMPLIYYATIISRVISPLCQTLGKQLKLGLHPVSVVRTNCRHLANSRAANGKPGHSPGRNCFHWFEWELVIVI